MHVNTSDLSGVHLGLDTFGDITVDSDDRPLTAAQTIRNVVDQAVLADEVGLSFFGVGEHHRPDFAVRHQQIQPRRGVGGLGEGDTLVRRRRRESVTRRKLPRLVAPGVHPAANMPERIIVVLINVPSHIPAWRDEVLVRDGAKVALHLFFRIIGGRPSKLAAGFHRDFNHDVLADDGLVESPSLPVAREEVLLPEVALRAAGLLPLEADDVDASLEVLVIEQAVDVGDVPDPWEVPELVAAVLPHRVRHGGAVWVVLAEGAAARGPSRHRIALSPPNVRGDGAAALGGGCPQAAVSLGGPLS